MLARCSMTTGCEKWDISNKISKINMYQKLSFKAAFFVDNLTAHLLHLPGEVDDGLARNRRGGNRRSRGAYQRDHRCSEE